MTNITPEEEIVQKNKYYTNFNVGILSMLMGVGTPFILPILGSVLAPILFFGGVIAVLIAKKPIWVKLLTVVLFFAPIVIWWDDYVLTVFLFTQSVQFTE